MLTGLKPAVSFKCLLFFPAHHAEHADQTHAAQGERGRFGSDGQVGEIAKAGSSGAYIAVKTNRRSNRASPAERDRLTVMQNTAGIEITNIEDIR